MTQVIDTLMHGGPGRAAAYLVEADGATALVDTGPASSLAAVREGLAARGVERLDWIVLTHIHLDHAGACGALAAEFPEARIAVHPRGARHIADPSRLWAGVSAVYGDRTEALWGRPTPVDPDRIHAFEDGARIALGDRALRAIACPGHARHQHAWLDEATGEAYVGDAVGMMAGGDELWRATTPPADFDRDAALASLERLRAAAPRRLWLGHYGAATEDGDPEAVGAILDRAGAVLRDWTGAIAALHTQGLREARLTDAMRSWLAEREAGRSPAASALLTATSDPSVDVAGVAGWLETHHAAEATP